MPVVVINSFSTSITTDPFDIDVTIKGAKPGTNYLRVELYKDGTTNYFGETYNGKDWYKGSAGQSYFPVNITSASSSATINVRIGNPSSIDYPGPGDYKLRIKRYTASGNSANDTQSPVDIKISYNLATPQVQDTQTVTPTILPSALMPYVSPTPLVTTTTTTIEPLPTKEANVLAAEITPSPSSTPTKNTFPFIPALIFAIGLFLIGITLRNVTIKNVRDSKKNN